MKQVLCVCLALFFCHAMGQENTEAGRVHYTDPNSQLRLVCDANCKDTKAWCSATTHYCNNSFWGAAFRVACPRSCGRCKKCPVFAEECTPGDGCRDLYDNCATLLAPLYCKNSRLGSVVQQRCPKSCGMCRRCDTALQCSPGCSDSDSDCPYWATTMQYCKSGSVHRGWMLTNCKKSCGICTPCTPTQPDRPTTTSASTTSSASTTPTLTSTTNQTVIAVATTAAVTTPSTAAPVINNRCERKKGRGLTLADQCLNVHNYYRCLHRSPEVTYDFQLERSAQMYANKLPSMDSVEPSQIGEDRDFGVGENLAWRMAPTVRFTIDAAVAHWYAEGFDYNFMSPRLTAATAEFTQMIWKDTRSIGCAMRRHKDETYVVVQYRSAGNNPATLEENVNWPIPEVCEANCDRGSCHGHEGIQSVCSCGIDGDQDQMPNCSGHCVVVCSKPESYTGEWMTTCEGEISCECKDHTMVSNGEVPGAQCDASIM